MVALSTTPLLFPWKHNRRLFIQAISAILLAQLLVHVSSCRFAVQAEAKRQSCDLSRAIVLKRTPTLLGEEPELLRLYCRGTSRDASLDGIAESASSQTSSLSVRTSRLC